LFGSEGTGELLQSDHASFHHCRRDLAEVLRVSVPLFFEGAPGSPVRVQIGGEAPSPAFVTEFMATSDGLALVDAFRRIKNVSLKRSIVRLADDE
jgi:hypothetical protein